MVRVPDCRSGGWGFESPRPRLDLRRLKFFADTEFGTESVGVQLKKPSDGSHPPEGRRSKPSGSLDSCSTVQAWRFSHGSNAKPWYWKARKGWYVTIGGARHPLGSDKSAATARFHELMAQPQKRIARSDSLAVIFDLFLDWCQKRRAPTLSSGTGLAWNASSSGIPICERMSCDRSNVQQWLDSMAGLASGSHRNYCKSVKRAMRWAKRQGYIDVNPIADLEEPRGGRRELTITEKQFSEIVSLVSNEVFAIF